MQPKISRKKAFAFVAVVAVLTILVIVIGTLVTERDTNRFGRFIKIQNYNDEVKNLSPEMRESMESYLYTVVKMNVVSGFEPGEIKDAVVRAGSTEQSYNARTSVYSGSFIIDIESVKQSYRASYEYLRDKSMRDIANISGNPVAITCLAKDKLKFGVFSCKDIVGEQASGFDDILKFLPYQNFSYKITPNSVENEGKLTLEVELTIPQSDLVGPESSKREVVAMYKKQVLDWVASKGVDASQYEYKFNYDDVGNLINQPMEGH